MRQTKLKQIKKLLNKPIDDCSIEDMMMRGLIKRELTKKELNQLYEHQSIFQTRRTSRTSKASS